MKSSKAQLAILQCPSFQCFTQRKPSAGEVSPVFKSLKPGPIIRKGSFFRTSDRKRVARYQCRHCGRGFSQATLEPEWKQKRRDVNEEIRLKLCSGVSQRRITRLLKINRKTVARKLVFLGKQARLQHRAFLSLLSQKAEKIERIQFDEMETFEHSKCLPLSIPLAVEARTRKILGYRVCLMPAKGLLAHKSRLKYGRRPDHRRIAARLVLREVAPTLQLHAHVLSDQNPKYPRWIREHLPGVKHSSVKGRRGCVVGQGELKKIGFDPLFSLNHTCAMIRANINRLFRRTWCTTKKRARLRDHLALYVNYHNQVLTA